jgi:hypothetical protein
MQVSRADVILIVVSVLGTAITFGLPVALMLARAIRLVSRLQHHNDLQDVKMEHLDATFQLTTRGLSEKIDHLGSRVTPRLDELAAKTRHVEGFLTKTTDYQSRD